MEGELKPTGRPPSIAVAVTPEEAISGSRISISPFLAPAFPEPTTRVLQRLWDGHWHHPRGTLYIHTGPAGIDVTSGQLLVLSAFAPVIDLQLPAPGRDAPPGSPGRAAPFIERPLVEAAYEAVAAAATVQFGVDPRRVRRVNERVRLELELAASSPWDDLEHLLDSCREAVQGRQLALGMLISGNLLEWAHRFPGTADALLEALGIQRSDSRRNSLSRSQYTWHSFSGGGGMKAGGTLLGPDPAPPTVALCHTGVGLNDALAWLDCTAPDVERRGVTVDDGTSVTAAGAALCAAALTRHFRGWHFAPDLVARIAVAVSGDVRELREHLVALAVDVRGRDGRIVDEAALLQAGASRFEALRKAVGRAALPDRWQDMVGAAWQQGIGRQERLLAQLHTRARPGPPGAPDPGPSM